MILDGQWELAISEISYPSMYHNVTEGKIMFYDEKFSKTTYTYYHEPRLYFSITDNVEAMNTLIQESNNHRDTWNTTKVSRITQKVKVYLTNEESSLAIFSTDVGHIFVWRRREKWFGKTHVWERFLLTNICVRYCSHPFTNDLHWHCRVKYCWRQKGAFAALLSIRIQAEIWWHNNYWTIHELSDF